MNNESSKKQTHTLNKARKIVFALGKYVFISLLFMLILLLFAAIAMESGIDLSTVGTHLQQHWLFWSVIRWLIYAIGAWLIYKLAIRSEENVDKRALLRTFKIYIGCIGLFEIMKFTA